MAEHKFISKLVDDAFFVEPWLRSTFKNDFLLLSEFSELEGPKPLFTIPDQQKTDFDLNAFAVRIMSVDCFSIMQLSSIPSFVIAGDTKVVLTETAEGAVAYVHHFVFYDIRARGFVRPYCLAYVSRNYTHLMSILNELIECFSLVTNLLHFGNALSFLNDLATRITNLITLKTRVQDPTYKLCYKAKPLTVAQKQEITVEYLSDVVNQISSLSEVFTDYAQDERFAECRSKFAHAFVEVKERVRTCHKTEESLKMSPPQIIEDITFDGIIFHEKPTYNIPTDVMASITGKKYDTPLRSFEELSGVTNVVSLDILRYYLQCFTKLTNVVKVDDCKESLFNHHNTKLSFGSSRVSLLHPRAHCHAKWVKKPIVLDDFFFLFKNKNTPDTSDAEVDKCFNHKFLSNSFLSQLKYSSLSSAAVSPISNESFTMISNSMNSKESVSSSNSNESYKEPETSSTCEKPSVVLSELDLNVMRTRKMSCLSLREKYSFLKHVVYTMCIGRPLVILAEDRHQSNIRKLIYSICAFLPYSTNQRNKIVLWQTTPVDIRKINTIAIIGLAKHKSCTLSRAITPYVSVIDFEQKTLLAPKYQGKLLKNMFDTGKEFHSEASYHAFINQIWSEVIFSVAVQFCARCGSETHKCCTPQALEVKVSDRKIIQGLTNLFVDQTTENAVPTLHLNNEKCTVFINKFYRRK